VQGRELNVREAALAPPRAHDAPLAAAVLRATAADFVVEEDLGFAPAGSGQHLLLRVRKHNANTQWVARELARIAGCRPGEVGYAGLKDRHAIAIQWFSVPRPRAPIGWLAVGNAEFEVLEAHPHTRKLPRGALAGNRFTVRLLAPLGDGARLAAGLALPLAHVARCGVPNYFGPQRFGRDGANLSRAGEELRRLAPQERGFVLSAARSAVFNAVLAARVADGSWQHLEAGDLANLDGRGSFFPVESADDTLGERCQRLQIHPTGPLWGQGSPATLARVLELELRLAAALAQHSALCVAAGMTQERRSLRLAVRELSSEPEAQAVVLKFRLVRGGFATAVLRELIEAPPGPQPPPDADTLAHPDNST
jgi:tRNA pseudouridine13 synthase